MRTSAIEYLDEVNFNELILETHIWSSGFVGTWNQKLISPVSSATASHDGRCRCQKAEHIKYCLMFTFTG